MGCVKDDNILFYRKIKLTSRLRPYNCCGIAHV